jgi:hypothetical protein
MAPNSFSIKDISKQNYYIDEINSLLVFYTKQTLDSVVVIYRTLPLLFIKKRFHKNKNLIQTNVAFTDYFYTEKDYNLNSSFVDVGNMNYNGSFSRALSFGNNQDVSFNSNFNLQLDGELGDSIHLTGAITDNTIPFQPEGNTQQLNEFDRVYLKLSRKKTNLIAGDFEVFKPNAYFMNFYKRVQGLQVNTEQQLSKNILYKISVSGAIAKGKYVRNIIIPIEGNQGPYKLTGPNGEQFFIVLANSEKVHIDGVQMQRGEELDYTIDYNTGEVVFMPRRLITKDMRVTIEFEFSDKNFLNSLIYVNNEWKIKNKLSVRFNAFSNQDSKNQPILQTLDSSQKYFLSTIGDSISQALYPSVRLVDTFSNSRIQYMKIDSTVSGILYPNIYVFSTNKDSAIYTLGFSYVGEGKGNYKQQIINTNGRVYQWTAPLNGQKQGNFEPVNALVTPKKIQLFTLGTSYDIDSNKNVTLETALSNNDPNTFSKKDNKTHVGLAAKLSYNEKRKVLKKYQLTATNAVSYEYLQANFTPIERYRTIEFNRDWNSSFITTKEEEHLIITSFEIAKSLQTKLNVQVNSFTHGKTYNGLQQIASLTHNYKGFTLLAIANILNQKGILFNSQYYRPIVQLEKRFTKNPSLLFGAKYLKEKNSMYKNDTLLANAFHFNTFSMYGQHSTKKGNNIKADYTFRNDMSIVKNEFLLANHSHTFSTITHIGSIEHHDINITGSYRNLQIDGDTSLSLVKPDESLLGRIDYTTTLVKGLIQASVLYEFGSGQEIKREFTYLEVPSGQGFYTWKDYNSDSIKQLNEFEIAIFQDEKRYIKIYTPTNQYVKAKYAQYNQTFVINPRAYWNGNDLKKYQKVCNLFYLQSALQLNNRYIGNNGLAQYNPFRNEPNDTLLISSNSSSIHTIYLNKFSNKWNIDFTQSTINNKTLLNYGIDTRTNKEKSLRGNYTINKSIQASLQLKTGTKLFSSLFLDNRNYKIDFKNISPSVSYIFNKNKCRLQFLYKYDERKNILLVDGEKAIANALSSDFTFNTVNKGTLRSSFSYTNISYNANANTTIGYTMLDGLQRGKNMVWTISIDRRISKSIEMNIEYNGRQSENVDIIHSGRASLRALF